MTITNKQQSKLDLLKELISDLNVENIEKVRKTQIILDNQIYTELISILKVNISEYVYNKLNRITHKQLNNKLDEILTTGKFTQIKLNKNYKSIICNLAIEDFNYIRYKEEIIYFK